MSTTQPPNRLSIGSWLYLPDSGALRRGDHEIRLPLQQQRLLELLLDHAGEVVERSTLFEHVWDGAAVEDNALARCVSELRRALGDDARQPTYIETSPKRGYRLLAPVAPAAPEPARLTRPPGGSRAWKAALASTGLCVLLLVGWHRAQPDPEDKPRFVAPPATPTPLPAAPPAAPPAASTGRADEAGDIRREAVESARAGRLDEAEVGFSRALAIYRELGLDGRVGSLLVDLGRVELLRSRWQRAADYYLEAEPLVRRHGTERSIALLLVNLGGAHAAMGNLHLAEGPLRQASERFRQLDDPAELAHALGLLAEVAIDRDQLDEALSAAREALDLREGLGGPKRIANSRVVLALAHLEAGEPERVEPVLAPLLGNDPEVAPNHRVLAWRLVARAHLAAGRPEAARGAIGQAIDGLADPAIGPAEYSRSWVPITHARVEIATGEPERAVRRLVELLDAPALTGLRLIEAEARLALAEAELATGALDRASRRLARLLDEAEGAGWTLLAAKANQIATTALAAAAETTGPDEPS